MPNIEPRETPHLTDLFSDSDYILNCTLDRRRKKKSVISVWINIVCTCSSQGIVLQHTKCWRCTFTTYPGQDVVLRNTQI